MPTRFASNSKQIWNKQAHTDTEHILVYGSWYKWTEL